MSATVELTGTGCCACVPASHRVAYGLFCDVFSVEQRIGVISSLLSDIERQVTHHDARSHLSRNVVVLFGSFFLAAIAFPVAIATTGGVPSVTPLFIIGILGAAMFASCVVLQMVIQCALRFRMQRECTQTGGHVVATNALSDVSPIAAPPAPAYYAAGAAPTVPQSGTTAPAPQVYGAPSSVPVAPPGYGAGAGAAYPPPVPRRCALQNTVTEIVIVLNLKAEAVGLQCQ
eukprot:m51a1_g5412 hypothetical protein (231) ;mRNA; r:92367-102019